MEENDHHAERYRPFLDKKLREGFGSYKIFINSVNNLSHNVVDRIEPVIEGAGDRESFDFNSSEQTQQKRRS